MGMVEFFVAGIPQQKGSKRPGWNKKTGKGYVRDTNPKAANWQTTVSLVAQDHKQSPLWEGPIWMTLCFYLPRPKAVSMKKRPYPITIPDLDKLVRTVADALTGVVYSDDNQICWLNLKKLYADGEKTPGVSILISQRA